VTLLSSSLPQTSIEGQLKILCTSRDPRNPQPTEEDIAEADYIFHRALNLETKQFEPVEAALDDYQSMINERVPGKTTVQCSTVQCSTIQYCIV